MGIALQPSSEKKSVAAYMPFPSYLLRLPEGGGISSEWYRDASRVRHFHSYIFRRLHPVQGPLFNRSHNNS
jgi:hypothetical protein